MNHLTILLKDKKLASIIKKNKSKKLNKNNDIYLLLLRSIVSQQLSVKAADTIWNRFVALFPNEYPTPEKVIKMKVEKFRKAGLSYQKAGYLKNIAEFSLAKKAEPHTISKMEDDEVIEHLTQIKGVGKWTVQMLLMFGMGRENIFPIDDLGILNAMKKLYKLKHEGKALKEKCTNISLQWQPYRTYACLYLWDFKDSK